MYTLPGNNKIGTGVMAADLIDPWYSNMKEKFPYKAHDNWCCQPLDKINKEYAAIDGFVASELYRVILDRKKAELPVGLPVGRKYVRRKNQDDSDDDSSTDVPEDSSDEQDSSAEEHKRRRMK